MFDPDTLSVVAVWVTIFVIGVGLMQNTLYALQLLIAWRSMVSQPKIRRTSILWRRYADLAPPIALISPAYNEERSIVQSVRSLMALRYASFEVIVVNDGSKDATLERLIEAFDLKPVKRPADRSLDHQPVRGIYGSELHPELIVVDKENGGKADALNAGINVSRAPIFCSMDADSVLESDALLRAVKPFVDDPGRTIAVGGTVRLANGCEIRDGEVVSTGLSRNLLALFQTVEYVRAFLMARLAWSRIGALTIISGAFGLFRRGAVIEAGGYTVGTVGEDMELVIKLHKQFRKASTDYRIAYISEPICWTEAPEDLRTLRRQRERWHRGSLETFFRHKDMFLNPRYGRVGSLGFLNILLIDVIGPLAEVLGYILVPLFYALGLLSVDYFLAFLALSFTFGITISVFALILEELSLKRFSRAGDLVILGAVAVLENFGYRQLNNFWRLRGTWQYLRGSQQWGEMKRKGFGGT
ncbi:MAG: glycosyl transferase [Henriciella sp.]|jgi:cellulose synthase/poly-beta-1,6-N-acetylglucosamine synthase-like glycosyltransferase|uniref:glycosyltransferase family 2 protein n=1 Tax=Henriciella sp. TaxID=1968823 RepID=UPI000C0DF9FC|nr:glycosyltransferase [Henriciella sp.]MAN74721.1 glycosyl transferase [Henriciella sp.]MBF32876.1 glycosyl transferase [Hyphomonadaceae bacterium]PHR78365.1 MAG: glycosyl transferase [Henriciella sp.]|tara:strand:- start:1299 stop:2714 length:1416 start_codon:yes stop_codon:yes gene_type:complete